MSDSDRDVVLRVIRQDQTANQDSACQMIEKLIMLVSD